MAIVGTLVHGVGPQGSIEQVPVSAFPDEYQSYNVGDRFFSTSGEIQECVTAGYGIAAAFIEITGGGGGPPGSLTADMFISTGQTGAASQSRWIGANVQGPPTSGTWQLGDIAPDLSGAIWLCVTAGTPGTWVRTGSTAVTIGRAGSGADYICSGTYLTGGDDIEINAAIAEVGIGIVNNIASDVARGAVLILPGTYWLSHGIAHDYSQVRVWGSGRLVTRLWAAQNFTGAGQYVVGSWVGDGMVGGYTNPNALHAPDLTEIAYFDLNAGTVLYNIGSIQTDATGAILTVYPEGAYNPRPPTTGDALRMDDPGGSALIALSIATLLGGTLTKGTAYTAITVGTGGLSTAVNNGQTVYLFDASNHVQPVVINNSGGYAAGTTSITVNSFYAQYTYTSGTAFISPTTRISDQVLAGTLTMGVSPALSTTLTAGTAYTSVTLAAPGLPFAVPNGAVLALTDGNGNFQAFTISHAGGYAAAATTLTVSSFTPGLTWTSANASLQAGFTITLSNAIGQSATYVPTSATKPQAVALPPGSCHGLIHRGNNGDKVHDLQLGSFGKDKQRWEGFRTVVGTMVMAGSGISNLASAGNPYTWAPTSSNSYGAATSAGTMDDTSTWTLTGTGPGSSNFNAIVINADFDHERVFVHTGSGDSWTAVYRGWCGTEIRSASVGATVYVVTIASGVEAVVSDIFGSLPGLRDGVHMENDGVQNATFTNVEDTGCARQFAAAPMGRWGVYSGSIQPVFVNVHAYLYQRNFFLAPFTAGAQQAFLISCALDGGTIGLEARKQQGTQVIGGWSNGGALIDFSLWGNNKFTIANFNVGFGSSTAGWLAQNGIVDTGSTGTTFSGLALGDSTTGNGQYYGDAIQMNSCTNPQILAGHVTPSGTAPTNAINLVSCTGTLVLGITAIGNVIETTAGTKNVVSNNVLTVSGNTVTIVGATSAQFANYNSGSGIWIATVNAPPMTSASVDLTGQTAAISATTLITPVGAEMVNVAVYEKITTAASSSSVLGTVTIAWTDPDNVSQTATIAPASPTGNSTTTYAQGSVICMVKAGTAVTYATTYTSVGGTAMAFNLHIRATALG